MSIIHEEGVPHWKCPDCGTTYWGGTDFRFCPKCRAEKDKLEKEYWDKKIAGQRSVAQDIVSQILAGRK